MWRVTRAREPSLKLPWSSPEVFITIFLFLQFTTLGISILLPINCTVLSTATTYTMPVMFEKM